MADQPRTKFDVAERLMRRIRADLDRLESLYEALPHEAGCASRIQKASTCNCTRGDIMYFLSDNGRD